MGIRIHKVLGWGLNHVLTKKGQIIDDRFSKESAWNSDSDKWNLENYKKHLNKELSKELNFELKLEYHAIKEEILFSFKDCFINPEPLSKLFMCVPISSYSEWYRYDNIIDHYESRQMKNKVRLLKDAVYPYLDYMDSRTGRKVDSRFSFPFRRWANANIPAIAHVCDESNILAKECGFQDTEECLSYMRPIVPKVIQTQLEFGEIFKDNKTIFSMEPMIATYWC